MKQIHYSCSEQDFITQFVQNGAQFMWFLGAGTSRTAGMPTATDIIWDLKRKYYCIKENQNLQVHDLNSQAVKQKIQSYLDSKSFPSLWSAEEYSFYFDLTFGADYSAQQKYINEQLATNKISLNIGHKVLAALIEMGLARVVFTTNFDGVIEEAYSAVAGKNLSYFHLEGSYAALDALNGEKFPIYAKIHGDFRYKSIKNLAADLLKNDEEIQKCFLAAGNRFGVVVSGYSGRDANVMAMFNAVLEQQNPFPLGLFWTVTSLSNVSQAVVDLIALARSRGVKAYLLESGTFDILLLKLWRQLPDKPNALDLKVRTAKANPVSIPLAAPGKQYPILRTNALAVIDFPKQCAALEFKGQITFKEVNDKVFEQKPEAVVCYTDRILFWGKSKSVRNLFDAQNVGAVTDFNFEDSDLTVSDSTIFRSFLEHALAESLCQNKPLKLRKKGKTYYAVVDHDLRDDERLKPLKAALAFKGTPADVSGSVGGLQRTFWAEAVSLRLEYRNKALWLLIGPDIWISPLTQRELAVDFLRKKKLYRYNSQSYQVLSEWIQLLLGSVGDQDVEISYLPSSEYPAKFKINARTAFSYKGGANG